MLTFTGIHVHHHHHDQLNTLNPLSKKIGKYTIVKNLGSSKYKVKQAIDEKDPNKIYALKIFKTKKVKDSLPYFEREKNAYSAFNHQNILKMVEAFEEKKYCEIEDKIKDYQVIAMEYATKKDLFEYVAKTGPFDEDCARMIFKQILDGVNHMHQSGYAHCDLKLENFFCTEDFSIKIADFDLSRPINQIIHEMVGTKGYMAPEILLGEPFTGPEVDVFSLGVILFILCAGLPPFKNADKDDPLYGYILKRTTSSFWKMWRDKKRVNLSAQLKNLLEYMWEFDPKNRISIVDILESEWMKMGENDSNNSLSYQKIMESRYAQIV